MAPRLHVIAEGQTEERYVNQVLVPHLGTRGENQVVANVRCVKTGRKRGRDYRGGLLSYEKARQDILDWMKEDDNPDSFFTTMFDLYALPTEFPGYAGASREATANSRVRVLESCLAREFGHPRFIPYIQLHEFEALILADPQKLDWEFLEHDEPIRRLVEMCAVFDSPEAIDDGSETAPSKRIISEIPDYRKRKADVGPVVAEKIGLDVLRRKCCHFGEWVTRLENLGRQT
jgi:hypothetical protein